MVERTTNTVGIPEDKQGKVKSWAEMKSYLSQNFKIKECNLKFARGYFRAERLISENKKMKAGKLFTKLDKIKGYSEFEEQNQSLLRTIDIAIKGRSNQEDF